MPFDQARNNWREELGPGSGAFQADYHIQDPSGTKTAPNLHFQPPNKFLMTPPILCPTKKKRGDICTENISFLVESGIRVIFSVIYYSILCY